MNVLIGCEESQVVLSEVLRKGHNGYSCDLVECSGKYKGKHLRVDIGRAIDLMRWDMIILHPPCTALAVSGNRWYGRGTEGYGKRLESIEWTLNLWKKACGVCAKVCLENPVGVLSGVMGVPQYVQPWMFGHGEVKKTGLWLYGLERLKETDMVDGREERVWRMPPSKDRTRLRSRTYEGIAKAMVNQWCD